MGDSDCEYEGCEMENMTFRFCQPSDGTCVIGSANAPDCEGIMEPVFIGDYYCDKAIKWKLCPEKKVDIYSTEAPIPSSDVEKESSEIPTAESKNALLGFTAILILSFIL